MFINLYILDRPDELFQSHRQSFPQGWLLFSWNCWRYCWIFAFCCCFIFDWLAWWNLTRHRLKWFLIQRSLRSSQLFSFSLDRWSFQPFLVNFSWLVLIVMGIFLTVGTSQLKYHSRVFSWLLLGGHSWWRCVCGREPRG